MDIAGKKPKIVCGAAGRPPPAGSQEIYDEPPTNLETPVLQIPEHIVGDVNLVVSLLRVSRDRLLIDIIEREVAKEKERLLMELGTLYAQGRISKADLVEMVGESLSDEMELVKIKTEQSWAGAMKYAG